MREQLTGLRSDLAKIQNHIANAGVAVNLSKVQLLLADLHSNLTALTDAPPEEQRKVIQIATTPDTVTALCEDGTVWCYDQSATWRLYPGVPAAEATNDPR